MAEQYTFRFIERWWRKQAESRKETEREAAKEREMELASLARERAEEALAGL